MFICEVVSCRQVVVEVSTGGEPQKNELDV